MAIKDNLHPDKGLETQEHDDILAALFNDEFWSEWAERTGISRGRQANFEDIPRRCPNRENIEFSDWTGPEIDYHAEVPVGRGEGKYYTIIGYLDLVVDIGWTKCCKCKKPEYGFEERYHYDHTVMPFKRVDDPPEWVINQVCGICDLSKPEAEDTAFWEVSIACEIKSSKEPSLGSVLRQISGYRKFVTQYRKWVVISPFPKWQTLLENQNIQWIDSRSFTGQSELVEPHKSDLSMVLI